MNLNWGDEREIEGEIEATIEANIEGGDKRDEQTGGVKRNRGEEEEGGGVAVKELLGFPKALVASPQISRRTPYTKRRQSS